MDEGGLDKCMEEGGMEGWMKVDGGVEECRWDEAMEG